MSNGISVKAALPFYRKHHGQDPNIAALRGWLLYHKVPRLSAPGEPVVLDRAAFLEILQRVYPLTPEQEAEKAKAVLLRMKPAPPAKLPPPRPEPDLARANLMSWTVAAVFKHVQDLATCPAHVAEERRRQAALFSNFVRSAVAPVVAGLEFDGTDAESAAIELARKLRGHLDGTEEAPRPPSWLLRNQERILIASAMAGVGLAGGRRGRLALTE